MRIAVLQRVCTAYRVPLFEQLADSPADEFRLFIGDDLPNSKVKSGRDLGNIPIQRLRTSFVKFGNRVLPWHHGLIKALRDYRPDVIVCEGESHFIGYILAIFYRTFFDRRCALIHWCYISLPGWPIVGGSGPRAVIKRFFRNFFDAFLVYSGFSRDSLKLLGEPEGKVFVATNVCDTAHFMAQADALDATPAEARQLLGLGDRFTLLYVGELDWNKRPDVLLDLASQMDCAKYAFVLLGSGVALEPLRDRARQHGLTNVFLPGRISDGLSSYFRAANAVIIPGRGGIIISEAMAYGVPVIVHQADGTEYDLTENGVTGIHLQNGAVADFRQAVETLAADPARRTAMAHESRRRVEEVYTTANMVRQIRRAAAFAVAARRGGQDPAGSQQAAS
jgi:glycosyltransferase involved in cell wall biosynthesis